MKFDANNTEVAEVEKYCRNKLKQGEEESAVFRLKLAAVLSIIGIAVYVIINL